MESLCLSQTGAQGIKRAFFQCSSFTIETLSIGVSSSPEGPGTQKHIIKQFHFNIRISLTIFSSSGFCRESLTMIIIRIKHFSKSRLQGQSVQCKTQEKNWTKYHLLNVIKRNACTFSELNCSLKIVLLIWIL